MDSPLSDPELLKYGGQYGGWVCLIFVVWWLRWNGAAQRRRDREQQRNEQRHVDALMDFAKAAIRSADNPYGKRRELDQKLAEGLAQLRAEGEQNLDRAVAKAVAHVERNGDDA